MEYKYFIAVNRDAYIQHLRDNDLDSIQCKFINDHHQLVGIRNKEITVIGHGNRALETAIVLNYSHHQLKLRYI